MMCVPPGWDSHSKIMIVPSSVIPAVSPAFAPHCSSMSALVAGMEPAGSPERISRSTELPARSIPSAFASWAMRRA
jgi:hypothetical protein